MARVKGKPNVILIGLGYWGPNLLRTFNNLGILKAAFDLDEARLEKFADNPIYKDIYFGTNWKQYASDCPVDAVVIATPPNTHHDIAMDVIAMGKHLFIEKPLTLKSYEAEAIVEAANSKELTVLVGHIFLYSPEITKLKEIIKAPEFGEINYIYIQRTNLGKIQSPANVIEDLAPHDISVLNYLLDSECVEVQSYGKAHVIETEDVAFINMFYPGDILCHLHLSWLDPLKVRNTVVVGTNQMAVCDSGTKSINIYNKKVELDVSNIDYAHHLLSYKYGDVISPYISGAEPMMEEAKDFVNCMESGKSPVAGAGIGLSVVRTLESMQKSLKNEGEWVRT
jgi:predicted dehydrogenase